MLKVNYELVGSIPAMEAFRNTLPDLIAKYEATRKTTVFAADTKIADALKNDAVLDRISLGVTIEMCAQHFYGMDGLEYNSMAELIDAIKSVDQELEFK